MADPHADQRLAAILAADVAGYSRLMEADERATVATLDAYRAVFQEHVAACGGRIVDTAGDSVLAAFPSAIGAVEAATAIQEALRGRNEALPEQQRMRFRIGVNLGDVIEKEDGSIYGSGVNVAARLEGLAEPGGICLSGSAHEQAEGKIDAGFQDIGEHAVKNIARPVRAYRIGADSADASPPEKPLALPDKPSIAVLPFDNLSGDTEQEYFADGIAEDLITALSCIRWLFVIARNSTFTYKGKPVKVQQVAEELGVRYVLEGSVRRGGNRVRISAQLIEATTGNHIWARRYDRELIDLFDLQDEIAGAIAAAIEPEIGEAERERARRKPPGNLDAWNTYQRGMSQLWRMTSNDIDEAIRTLQRATELDPNFAQAYAGLGYSLFLKVAFAYTNAPRQDLDQALQAASNAIALDEKEALGHFALGRTQTLIGEFDTAIAELQTAVELNPNLAIAHYGLAFALTYGGEPEQAIPIFDTAIRLSPHDPAIWTFYGFRGLAYFLLQDYEAAIMNFQRAIRHPRTQPWPYAWLASALAQLDRFEEARAALKKLLKMRPDYTPAVQLASASPLDPKAMVPLFQPWIDGLRKAGLDIADEPADAE